KRSQSKRSVSIWVLLGVHSLLDFVSTLSPGVEDATMVTGEELNSPITFLVYLNGTIIGVHTQPNRLVTMLRHFRRTGRVSEFLSVFVNDAHKAVYISCDGGRLCRPLILVQNG